MTRRLSRRAPVVHAVAAVIPAAVALGALVMAEPDDVRDARRHVPVDLPAALIVSSTPPSTPVIEGPRPLPPALAAVALDRRAATASSEELSAIVAGSEHAPGERYVALRRLETLSPATAVAEAERVAMTHGAADDPWIALNALSTLARLPEGRAALARCAEAAPSPRVREAATRLARR
ncbi:MAG: hypothetical protein M9894_02175 [Planctomycetes bacterium]|nr:hypothetical protein [Planctomycetota bacterium]